MSTPSVRAVYNERYTYPNFVAMETISCSECGVFFGVTDRFNTSRRADGRDFYCPNGHPQAYWETTEERLRRKLASEQEETRIAWARVQERYEQLEAERRRHSATKGQLTKTKKRVAAGVCPCCNRTFQQLSRHMANKHPDFSSEESA